MSKLVNPHDQSPLKPQHSGFYWIKSDRNGMNIIIIKS